jgi:predicted N-formylglutamate amidohydrolase
MMWQNHWGIMTKLLGEGEPHPADIINANGTSPYVLICEHASNALPQALGTLGLSDVDLKRHIAWDIGAEGTSRILARILDAPLILQRYSRLAYDCNRPPEADASMPELSEIFEVPGNRNLTPQARLARTNNIYRPFNRALETFLDERASKRTTTIPVSMHSFTRSYKGVERKLELGLLFDRDPWLANQLVKAFPGIDVRLNEPYGPKDGVMHLMNLHAAPRGLKHLMIEIRNDLIEHTRGQEEWAQRLSVPFIQALAKLGENK